MGKPIRLFWIAALVLFLFILPACQNALLQHQPETRSEYPYLGETLIIDDLQVWRHNRYTTRISQSFFPYNEAHETEAIVYMPAAAPVHTKPQTLSAGEINARSANDVALNITIGKYDIENYLIKFDNRLVLRNGFLRCDSGFSCEDSCYIEYNCSHGCPEHEWYVLSRIFREWKNVRAAPADVRGNMVLIYAKPLSNGIFGMLDRHRFTGTASSLTMETILYIYVDRDCRITGEPDKGIIPGNYYYYSQGSLDLSLKKGFNMVTRRETYLSYGSGSAYISMEIRNPLTDSESYKWVIELGYDK